MKLETTWPTVPHSILKWFESEHNKTSFSREMLGTYPFPLFYDFNSLSVALVLSLMWCNYADATQLFPHQQNM